MSRRNPLVQLPDGNWVDPDEIVSVEAVGLPDAASRRLAGKGGSPLAPIVLPGVFVRLRRGVVLCLPADSFEDAASIRDRIAVNINGPAPKTYPPHLNARQV